jgi:hypothetical protein
MSGKGRKTHLKERHEIGLGGLLEGHNSGGLEAQVRLWEDGQRGRDGWRMGGTDLEVLGDFTDEALEGELADEELGGLLVATDFTEGDGSRAETMGLLDTSGSVGGLLACTGLGGELKSGLVDGGCVGRRRRTCLRGALPPVDCGTGEWRGKTRRGKRPTLRAVCLVRAIDVEWRGGRWW